MQIPPRLPWRFLLAAMVVVPLAVGVVPLSGTPLTLNVFVQAKLIALCLTLSLALGVWALLSLRDEGLALGRPLVPFAVFLAVGAASAATSLSPRIAVFGDFEQGVGLLVVALCALAGFLVAQHVRDAARLRELTSVVVLTATGIAAIGALQQVAALDLLGIAGPGLPVWMLQRGYGTIGNADSYGAYLVLPAILAFGRLRGATTQRDRLVWGSALVLLLASCVMSQTRAPLAGLIAGAVAYAVGEARRRRRQVRSQAMRATPEGTATSSRTLVALLLAAIGVGAVIASTAADASDFGARLSLQSLLALGGRLPLWTSALRIAAEHPLLGVGPDSFRLGWYPVREIAHLATGAGLVITDPHSVPLLLAATTGVAGVLAAGYLAISSLITGFATVSKLEGTNRRASDYDAWLCGAIALLTTMLAAMLTSVLLFMLLVAVGVLIAPALKSATRPSGASGATVRALALALSAALMVFGLLAASAHLIAVGARGDNTTLDAERASRAAALAPWDTGIRELRYETMIQAALERVFTADPGAASAVEEAAAELEDASAAEPHDYLPRYRSALLLIGSGQLLGKEFTVRGVDAGLEALSLYPNSVELRTGVSSGYLQLDEPGDAEALLETFWDADPDYVSAGVTYAEALLAQGKVEIARSVVSMLRDRFPEDEAVAELVERLPAN